MTNTHDTLVRGFLRRAIATSAPLLATRLERYLQAEEITWEELARRLGCTLPALEQVALCRPPREERFVADVEEIAGEYVEPARLLPLLRELQVLDTLGEAPAPGTVAHSEAEAPSAWLLAAREREEGGDG